MLNPPAIDLSPNDGPIASSAIPSSAPKKIPARPHNRHVRMALDSSAPASGSPYPVAGRQGS